MKPEQAISSLSDLLDRLNAAAQKSERVPVRALLQAVGRRSFAPLLLLAGLITLAPIIGDIPGMPTAIGLVTLVVSVQMLCGRDQFWLPKWVLKRPIPSAKLKKAMKKMRRPAKFVDRLLRPRLEIFSGKAATYGIAAACTVIGAAMPVMEVVPFSANLAGAALAAFGLALIAHDGLWALIAFSLTTGIVALVVYTLL
jgi:hypothetical protein